MPSKFGHDQNRRLASYLYGKGIRYSTYTKKAAKDAVRGTVGQKRLTDQIDADSLYIKNKLRAIHRNPALYSLHKTSPGAPGLPKRRKFSGKIYDFNSRHKYKKDADREANRLRKSGFNARIVAVKGKGYAIYRNF